MVSWWARIIRLSYDDSSWRLSPQWRTVGRWVGGDAMGHFRKSLTVVFFGRRNVREFIADRNASSLWWTIVVFQLP